MSYRMTRISDTVRIGQRSNGDFDIEVEAENDDGELVAESVFVPSSAAEEVAKYLLRNT